MVGIGDFTGEASIKIESASLVKIKQMYGTD
jgi:hypothetical protein